MRRSFIGGIQRVGSKSATSAAQCARQALVSNVVSGAMPWRPAISASRNPSWDVPNGETMPSPVTAIPVATCAYVTIAVDVAATAQRASDTGAGYKTEGRIRLQPDLAGDTSAGFKIEGGLRL